MQIKRIALQHYDKNIYFLLLFTYINVGNQSKNKLIKTLSSLFNKFWMKIAKYFFARNPQIGIRKKSLDLKINH